jgi:hypothetical protein
VVDDRLSAGVVDDPLEDARLPVDLARELVERSLNAITASDRESLRGRIIDHPRGRSVKRVILQAGAYPLHLRCGPPSFFCANNEES